METEKFPILCICQNDPKLSLKMSLDDFTMESKNLNWLFQQILFTF